jgi:hypothetical protein
MFCGSQQCTAVTIGTITCPTGISATISNNGTANPTITFKTTATISTACEATIPITSDGVTINKKFSFAVAKTGATGASGDAGATWYRGTAITGTSTTATVFSGSGITAAKVNDQYLNTSTGNVYTCTTAGAASAAKWVYSGNIKGATGASAIRVEITSDAGNVFKNNSGSITLTAHVYCGATEATISDAGAVTGATTGTIKWYKGDPGTDSTLTAVATAKTLTVSATDVLNAQVYTCQLE